MKLIYQLLWLAVVGGFLYRAYSIAGADSGQFSTSLYYYAVNIAIALNFAAMLTIFYGLIFNKQKRLIAPYLVACAALLYVATKVLHGLPGLALLYANAFLFHSLPFHVFKKKKPPPPPVRAFDERTRV